MTFVVSQFSAFARILARPRLLVTLALLAIALAIACRSFGFESTAAPAVAGHRIESPAPLLVLPLVFCSALQALLQP